MSDGTDRPLVVWLAGVAWDGIAGTDRHLVTHLAEHVDVLWVDPPRSVVSAVRRGGRRPLLPAPDEVVAGVRRLRPPAPPFPHRPGVDLLTMALLQAVLRRTLRRLGRRAAMVVATSPHPRLSMVPGARRVYYATDDFVAGAALMGKRAARFERIERRRLAEADVAGAVSPEITARWSTTSATVPTFVLPNGCDVAHYADVDAAGLPADLPADLGAVPVAGVVGQLSARIDLALLEALAQAGVRLLLVGPLQTAFEPERVTALLARPEVTWVGPKRFEELPGYLSAIDVGLTPYVEDSFNRASFPLKTLEYLAAGRSVVSTPLPAVDRLQCPWIRTGRGPAAFVAATRAALAETRDATTREERREFALRHDWADRARELLEVTGLRLSVSQTEH